MQIVTSKTGAPQVVLVVKNLPTNAGDLRDAGSIPGSGRSPGGGHDNPLWYSCLENPMDREDWWATVHRVTKSRTPLNTCACKTKTKQKANKQNMKGDNLVSAQ